MLALSSKSPWKKYATFNKWFAKYGKLYTIPMNGFDIKKYDRMKTKKIFKDIKKLIVTITREDAGHVHEPVDKLHDVKLPKEQRKFQAKMLKDKYVENEKGLFMGDTPASCGQKLHQVGGGFVKGEDKIIRNPKWVKGKKKKMKRMKIKKLLSIPTLMIFSKNPKVQYIKENFDPEKTMILAYYKAEQDCIADIFPHTGSTTKNAEGIDYSHFDDMVIYSHNHSSATFQQVRVRQANINRTKPITVHFLIAGEFDLKVYNIASGKEPYTRRWYE